MGTSGTYSFTQNRDEIIKGALRLVGAIKTGQAPSAENMTDAGTGLSNGN